MGRLRSVLLVAALSAGCASDPAVGPDAATAARDAAVGSSLRDAQTNRPPPGKDSGATTLDAGSGDAGMPQLGAIVAPGDPGSADVVVEVHADQDMHAISTLIYGVNGGPDLSNNRFTLVRSGGNRLTAYNWENNASNAGSDYQFQNDGFLSNSNQPAKPIVDGLVQASAAGAQAIVTVPLVDYVSADKNGGGDVRNSGSNYLMTRFKQNVASKPAAFDATPDTGDAYVYQDEFVAYLKAHAPAGLRVLFSLDNEPDLWSSTHAEVHPDPVTYAELWERTERFASAIKKAWPQAPVLGPVSYGWNGYISLQNASDQNGRDFLEWYLDQAKAAQDSGGTRLIDYLDLHWYPEARGGGTRIIEQSTAAAVVAAREQAPRSLWDDSYEEDSWIQQNVGGPIDLIHRLHSKIDAHYPGTKLAFTEWNYGAGGHISGAIACADVLGIFGRDGVDLATYWALSDDERFAYAAFRAYRNFDGSGGSFGEVSVAASTSDVQNVTAYASVRGRAADPVVVLINKATDPKTVALRLSHSQVFARAALYQLTGTQAALVAKPEQPSAAVNAWKLSLPAQSVSVVVPRL